MQDWNSREHPSEAPPRKMPDLIWKTLFSRGIRSSEEVDRFFSPKLKDLRDPLSLKDMDRAVERLLVAFENKEKICVYGDFDLDGTSGLALLKQGLEGLGFETIEPYQPLRLTEGYGVHVAAIEKIAKECSLVVTVDVGITAVEAVARANELGLDVIVTDHHLPAETLPEAVAVVNPNQKKCDSGLGHLCGTGVGFFLFLALRRAMKEKGWGSEFDPKNLLDCFVIGTLTDLVPVIDENRSLVKHGLLQLAETQRPGLKRLLKQLGLFGRPLTSQDVAIRFAPKINALSRMEKTVRPIDLYLVDNDLDAKNLVTEVLACNEERIALQAAAEQEAATAFRKSEIKNVVWVASESFHRGVVGLVATKMTKAQGVPAFIGATTSEGVIVGSARRPDDSEHSLLDALDYASDALEQFGGHSAAAGFELKAENAEAFGRLLSEYWQKQDSQAALPPVLYDGVGTLPEISPQFMNWYDGLGPFGTDFDTPVFLFESVVVSGVRELKGGHLKLTLKQEPGFEEREALWFSPPSSHPLLAEEDLVGASIDVLAEPQWNYFAGRKTIQLLVKDIRARWKLDS